MKLTSKQKTILECVRELSLKKGQEPTSYRVYKYLNSLGAKESMKSIMQVIESLEKKDLITRDEDRRLYLVENSNFADNRNILSVPLYGLASCGEALAYAHETADDYLQISKTIFYRTDPKKLFAVKALGDSMNKDGIDDGDYVIFEKTDGAGEYENKIVVAVINGMATIKRYKSVGEGIVGLFPHSTNVTHHPIYIAETDSAFIAGVFKKVLPVAFVSL